MGLLLALGRLIYMRGLCVICFRSDQVQQGERVPLGQLENRGCGHELLTEVKVVPEYSWSFCSQLLHFVNSASLGDLCLVSCFWMIMHLPESIDKALGAAD